MQRIEQPERTHAHVAIIGGGASGTRTAAQLLRNAAVQDLPLQVTLIDRLGRHGLGQAYATDNEVQLLNAMAGQMSALADEPGHLTRWAGVTKETFLSRRAYGRYLQGVLADAERQAPPAASLTRLACEVVAIRRNEAGRPLRLILPDGWLGADVAVLAVGSAGAVPIPGA